MIRGSATLILVLICFIYSFSQDQKERNWTLNGYVKNLQSVYKIDGFDSYLIDNLVHNRLNFKWYTNDHLTVRVEMRNRLFYGDLVKLSPGFGDQIEEANNDVLDLSFHWQESEGSVINSTLDRVYLEYVKNNWEIRLGRQRINWGISTVWNPNDVFNAFSFTDFDYEERPGSDALRVKHYTGVASSIEVAVNAAETWDERVAAMLFKWNAFQYDFQLLSGVANNEFVLGAGWAGNVGNAGLKGEMSYFTPLEGNDPSSFAFTIGADYSFSNSLYTGIGYLYNSNGVTRGSLADLFSFQLSAKNLYPFRHALFANASYPITPLINGVLAIIYSPVPSKPLFINPTLTWSIAQNWDLDIVGQLAFNNTGERYTSPITAIFIRLKVSF